MFYHPRIRVTAVRARTLTRFFGTRNEIRPRFGDAPTGFAENLICLALKTDRQLRRHFTILQTRPLHDAVGAVTVVTRCVSHAHVRVLNTLDTYGRKLAGAHEIWFGRAGPCEQRDR